MIMTRGTEDAEMASVAITESTEGTESSDSATVAITEQTGDADLPWLWRMLLHWRMSSGWDGTGSLRMVFVGAQAPLEKTNENFFFFFF